MRGLSIIIALLLTITAAERQPAKDVINKFREVAPKYLETWQTVETVLGTVQQEAKENIVQFHEDIIIIKESFVVAAIKKESEQHSQLNGQAYTVDRTCLGFLNTTLDMGMDLAGAGFTNCVNDVDEAFNELVAEYLNVTAVEESVLNELRLLDVFRGDNVFYTPQNIIDKLDKKLTGLNINPENLSSDLEAVVVKLKTELDAIRLKYAQCMTQADQLLVSVTNLITAQLTFSCLGSVI